MVRPALIPDKDPLLRLDKNVKLLAKLAELTAPLTRHNKADVPLWREEPICPESTKAFFSNDAVESRFASGLFPVMHLHQGEGVALAYRLHKHRLFLRETNTSAMDLSFIEDELKFSADLLDIQDKKAYPALYTSLDWENAHALSDSVAKSGAAGLLTSDDDGHVMAVLMRAELITSHKTKRGITARWNGHRFTAYYDHSALTWFTL